MRLALSSLILATMTLVGSAVQMQHVHPTPATNAAGTTSLSPEQVQQLLDGDGMGLAKPAELNHYPGPKHALELSTELALTADQTRKVTEIRERMLAEAKRLGQEIVDAERALDAAFAAGSITQRDVASRTASISALSGRLRAVHLGAHLETLPVLTKAQVAKYYELRAKGQHE